MKFTLGGKPIMVINDGGLGIQYATSNGMTMWEPHETVLPTLSLEVSPRT
jgi:hypothetical protein